MSQRFNLCPEMAWAYSQLTFNCHAKYKYVLAPFQTLYWYDERPDNIAICGHLACYTATTQLLVARQQIWDYGGVEEDLADFWADALSLIPEWPGFRRLDLSDSAREFMKELRQEGLDFFKEMMLEKEIRLHVVDRLPGPDDPRRLESDG